MPLKSDIKPPREGETKTAVLGRLGQNLSGGAIGVLIARFVLWCGENKYTPVLDFRGVENLGWSVVESACLFHSSSCTKENLPGTVKVYKDSFLKTPDAANFLHQALSKLPSREENKQLRGSETN